MKRSLRLFWWCLFVAASAAVVGALGWVTIRVVQLQREEASARGEVRRQELIRQALWRMDSWLSPRLAREGARTWFEYESYYPQTMAYNQLLQPMTAGTVVLPSPLLDFRSEFLPLHFQYRAESGFTSPQVPSELYSTAQVSGCSPVKPEPTRAAELATLAKETDPNELQHKVEAAEARMTAALSEEFVFTPPSTRDQAQQAAAYDLKTRQSTTNAAQQLVQLESQPEQQRSAGLEGPPVQVGAMVPLWLGDPPDRLVLARRVRTAGESMLQGVIVQWPALKRQLLARVADLMPGADLRPAPAASEPDPAVALASLPVVLAPPPGLGVLGAAEGGASLAWLGIVWFAAIGALATTGLALRSSIASAVQTSRFASSVTHELRTPLTTFRLYAEMLADGMVPEGESREQYLRTLRDESARLGFLVENVLTWSRVEEGRASVEPRRISAQELVSAAEPVLRHRCKEAEAAFQLELATEPIHTSADADRVRQVLFNLVDNACKYAGERATIRLTAALSGSTLLLGVEDDGAGIPPTLQARIFRPFDRGERGPGDAIRGLGLGLAISRELARSLGGELRCTTSQLGGARFELALPVTA